MVRKQQKTGVCAIHITQEQGVFMNGEKEALQQDRLQHQLEIQSYQIERVFSHYNLDAQVTGGDVQARSISFNLHGQLAARMVNAHHQLKGDLMRSLGTTSVNFKKSGDHLCLVMDKPSTVPVPLLDLMPLAQPLPPLAGAIGMSENGRCITLNFSDRATSHVLVTGEKEAGKTTLLRTLAVSLAVNNRQSKLQLMVIAPQTNIADIPYAMFEPLQHLPHMVTRPYYGIDEAREALDFLEGEIAYRREQQINTPALIVLIDDLASLLGKRSALRKQLVAVLQNGSNVGIHVVMGTRDVETAVYDSPIRANISHRLIGRCADKRQSQIGTGMHNAQAEYLLGQGDFLAVRHEKATYFQAASINDYDLHMTLQELHRNRPRPLLAQSFSTRTALDVEDLTETTTQQFIFDGHSVSNRYDTPPTWQEESGGQRKRHRRPKRERVQRWRQ